MKSSISTVLQLVTTVLLLVGVEVRGNVIGIDLGSENMKVGLVSPGKFDIVTNFQSKRKTPVSLTFYRNERMFGSDSTALMSRKPELTFSKLLRMVGKPRDHPDLKVFKDQYFPTEFVTNETTGYTALKLSEDVLYSPEELLGMMLQHAKDITKDYANGQSIKDCVITVPSSFTQRERRALYDAASLVDLKVLSLIEENTAAALHFGIDRVFEEPHNVLFYNMGAGTTQVTIAQYSSLNVKEGGKNKTIGQFQIVGKAWDDRLGGFDFDLVITELLADRFNAIWNKKKSGEGKDVRDFLRPMTKLRVEATKLREILSANQEMSYKAEQLHADTDMYTKITRSEFEEASTHLFSRVTSPITEALAFANMTLDDIHAVELLGGGIRMPRVKQELEKYFAEGDLDLGVHLNGDEAMALGAAFRAANLSTAFKVRKVGVADMSVFGVTVELQGVPATSAAETEEGGSLSSWLKPLSWLKKKTPDAVEPVSEEKEEEEQLWSKSTALFAPKTLIPAKIKTVAFQHTEDIICRLSYDDSEESPFLSEIGRTIGVFNISGIAAFSQEVAKDDLGPPKIHLSFTMDAGGMVTITKAEATVDLPLPPPDEESGGITSDDKVKDITDEEVKENDETTTANEGTPSDSAEKQNESTENSGEEDVKGEESASKEGEETEEKADSKKDKKDTKKDKKKKDSKKKEKKPDTQLRRTLVVEEDNSATTPPQMSKTMINASRKKLTRLTAADIARKARETALNDLESYVYAIRNRLRDEDGKDQLGGVSTEVQREEIITSCNDIEEWLYDEGRNAELSEFKAKENEIKLPADKIFRRFKESIDRPKAVKRALKQLHNVTKKVSSWKDSEKMSHISEEEVKELMDLVAGVETWIAEKVAAQESADVNEDPVFHSYDVVSEMKAVTAMLEKLLRKPKPKPPKAPASNASDSNSTNSTEGEEPETVYIDLNEGKEESQEQEEKKEEEGKEDVDKEEEGKEEQDSSSGRAGDDEL